MPLMIFFNFQLAIRRIKLTYPQNVPCKMFPPLPMILFRKKYFCCCWHLYDVAELQNMERGNTWESGIWVRWEYTGAQNTKTEIHRRVLWPMICVNWLQTDQETSKLQMANQILWRSTWENLFQFSRCAKTMQSVLELFPLRVPIKYQSADFVCKGVPLPLPVKTNSLI